MPLQPKEQRKRIKNKDSMNYDDIDLNEISFETFKKKYINEYEFDLNFIEDIINYCDKLIEKYGTFTSFHPYVSFTRDPVYQMLAKKTSIKITKATKLGCEPRNLWFQFYRENDYHGPHDHGSDLSTSGIMYFNEIGGTTFMNPFYYNFLSKHEKFLKNLPYKENREIWEKLNSSHSFFIKSKPGKIITFPSHIIHWVESHLTKDNIRYIASFNIIDKEFIKI